MSHSTGTLLAPRLLSHLAVVLLSCVLMSCSEDEAATGVTQFTDRLTLGTGANASNTALTGESSAFISLGGVAVIYWRLESATELGGAGVALKIEKKSGSNYTLIGSYPYASPRSYGHIVISSISLADAGTFRATGLLTSTATEVASTTFTVRW